MGRALAAFGRFFAMRASVPIQIVWNMHTMAVLHVAAEDSRQVDGYKGAKGKIFTATRADGRASRDGPHH